jgi:amino acid permease
MVIFWDQLYGHGKPSSIYGQTFALLLLLAFVYENGYKIVMRKDRNAKLFYIGYVIPGVFAILGYLYTLLIR